MCGRCRTGHRYQYLRTPHGNLRERRIFFTNFTGSDRCLATGGRDQYARLGPVERQETWRIPSDLKKDDPAQETQWSLYVDNAHRPGPQLNRLLEAYRQRLMNHARQNWSNLGTDLDDVLQSFFTKFLEGNIVRHARRDRGRFRDFLRRCFDNWVKDHLRGKRMGQLDDAELPDDDPMQPSDFERIWCEEVLLESAVVAKQQCVANGRPDLWHVIQDQILSPILDGTKRLSHAELAQKYRYATENVAAGKVRTAKKWFDISLKQVVGQYVADEEIEHELDEFFRILPNAMHGISTKHHWLEREIRTDLKAHDEQAWGRVCDADLAASLITYADALEASNCPLELLALIKEFAKHEAQQDEGPLAPQGATQLYLAVIATARLRTASNTALSSFSNAELMARLEKSLVDCVDPAASDLLSDRLNKLRQRAEPDGP